MTGRGSFASAAAGPITQSFQNLVAWSWVKDSDRRLIVVNLSQGAAQGRVHVPWEEVRGAAWHLTDVLSGWSCDRDGEEMVTDGLYIELAAWSFYFFKFLRARMLFGGLDGNARYGARCIASG